MHTCQFFKGQMIDHCAFAIKIMGVCKPSFFSNQENIVTHIGPVYKHI